MFSLLRTQAEPRKPRAFFWRWFGASLLLACLVSCSSPPEETSVSPKLNHAKKENPSDLPPDELLYEQLRSGSFQLNAAAGSIEDTLTAAKQAAKKLKSAGLEEAIQDVVEFVDSAGEGVSEYSDDPPSKEEVAKNFSANDEKRLKAIEAANDALHDLREAKGILESLSENESRTVSTTALSVKALLAVAIDDLWGAIEALGGEPELDSQPLNP